MELKMGQPYFSFYLNPHFQFKFKVICAAEYTRHFGVDIMFGIIYTGSEVKTNIQYKYG